MKDEAAFWWKDAEPDTPPQPACLRSPDLQPSQSYPFETPSILSSSSHTERDVDKCEELIDKSEAILNSSGCHDNSFPVQEGYRGTHHQPPLTTHHQPPLSKHHQPPLSTYHQPPLTHHQPPLPTHHEDILYQWRLRRRLEQTQDIIGNCHIDVKCNCGNDHLASVNTPSCFAQPNSCYNGIHPVSVMPKMFDSVLKTQEDAIYTEVPKPAVLEKTPVTVHNLQSTGTQTTPDCSQEGSFPCVPLGDPHTIPCIRPKPSVLYPDTLLLATTADTSFNNSTTSDFEQSFSTTTCTAEVHPLVSEVSGYSYLTAPPTTHPPPCTASP